MGDDAERRRLLLRRTAPVVVVALIAFVVGAIAGSGGDDGNAAERFARAWSKQDWDAMHEELSPGAAAQTSAESLQDAYLKAQSTASVTGIGVGTVREQTTEAGSDVVPVEMLIRTNAFGTIDEPLLVPVGDGGVEWAPHLVFPGLQQGERLDRRTRAPERAAILARDGSPLVRGDGEPIPGAVEIVGDVGAATPAQAERLTALGFPEDESAGNSGLELALNERLAGKPGGELLAVGTGAPREIAKSEPEKAKPLRTTLDPEVQNAASSALSGRFGGVAAIDTRTGAIRGIAGVALSSTQPPGSTFKIITAAAGLEGGEVKPNDSFEAVTEINAGGRVLSNAHDELCGGTFVESFAHSCNTVFAPLAVEVGGPDLVKMAEKFGFNALPPVYPEAITESVELPQSTIPPELSDSVEVAVSGIGQGEVLSTTLEMATIAQTIANKGKRLATPIVKEKALQPELKPVQAIDPKTAAQITEMMVAVVRGGTGNSAALTDVQVAGKTGTAEIGPKPDAPPPPPGEDPEQAVDAWFTAFAPAEKPRIAVAVMIPNADGDGGEIAAPIARSVIAAALGAG